MILSTIKATADHKASGHVPPILDEASAKALIDKVNHDGAIQSGFEVTKVAKPESNEFLIKLFKAIGEFIQFVAKLFEPLGPILPFLAIILILLVIGFLLSPLVRLMLRQNFERFWPSRHNLRADSAWVPTEAAVTALLSEIDALAARGDYDGAVHLLLFRTLADLNARKSNLIKPHLTARDILSHPLLPPSAHGPFGQIVRAVELSFFAGMPVGKDGFEACRAAYVTFLTSQGIRVASQDQAEAYA